MGSAALTELITSGAPIDWPMLLRDLEAGMDVIIFECLNSSEFRDCDFPANRAEVERGWQLLT